MREYRNMETIGNRCRDMFGVCLENCVGLCKRKGQKRLNWDEGSEWILALFSFLYAILVFGWFSLPSGGR